MSIEFPRQELGEMQTADERLEMKQQIEAAKSAIDTMDQGIETRKELIANYQARLEGDIKALTADEFDRYSKVINGQGEAITQYEKTRTDFVKVIDRLELKLSGPEAVDSLADLKARYGKEFSDSQEASRQGLEIHVDRPEN